MRSVIINMIKEAKRRVKGSNRENSDERIF